MKVSIVIPVYNEADHLAACLVAIQNQTVAPLEVIVVDNNSTDDCLAVARRFSFVKVLSEPRQGVVYARNRGYSAAKGEIIGRIDGDTILEPDWVENLQLIFSDPEIAAVSGSVHYYDMALSSLSGAFDLFFRQWLANRLGDQVFLYGANMAMRRSAWQYIQPHLCAAKGLHEDFDLAIHLEDEDFKVVFDRRLHAAISLRRFDGNILDFWDYAIISPATYSSHNRISQRYMYVVIGVVAATYWLIRFFHSLYNPKTGKVSFRYLLSGQPAVRVNPATYVD